MPSWWTPVRAHSHGNASAAEIGQAAPWLICPLPVSSSHYPPWLTKSPPHPCEQLGIWWSAFSSDRAGPGEQQRSPWCWWQLPSPRERHLGPMKWRGRWEGSWWKVGAPRIIQQWSHHSLLHRCYSPNLRTHMHQHSCKGDTVSVQTVLAQTLSPHSFPGAFQNHLIPQGTMSLLHPLTWSLTGSLCLPAAFPVNQDLALKKSQWKYPQVRSSLVRPRNPNPGKLFDLPPITHCGWVVTGLHTANPMISFFLPVQPVMKTKSAEIPHAALPYWEKVSWGGWHCFLSGSGHSFHRIVLVWCLLLTKRAVKTVCSVTHVQARLKHSFPSDQFFSSKTFCASHMSIIQWKQTRREISSWVHLHLCTLSHFQGSQ